METITLNKQMNIIDYIIENQEKCSGRKVFTNTAMMKRLEHLSQEVKVNKRNYTFIKEIDKTGNKIKIEFFKETFNCFRLENIEGDNIKKLAPFEKGKECLYVINEKCKTKEFVK
jgi:hypothetical protein